MPDGTRRFVSGYLHARMDSDRRLWVGRLKTKHRRDYRGKELFRTEWLISMTTAEAIRMLFWLIWHDRIGLRWRKVRRFFRKYKK